jgi:hypothetical protein
MLAAAVLGALILSTPSQAQPSRPAAQVDVFGVTRSLPGTPRLLELQPRLLLRLKGRGLEERSQHRESEGGAVILEQGRSGTKPLHCRGHRFFTSSSAQ